MIAFTGTFPTTILPLGLVKFLLFYTKLHHFYHANFVLHSGHHDPALSSWEFGECKLIIIAINPPFVNLNILMMGASIRFICLPSCMVFHRFGWIILDPAHKLFMWVPQTSNYSTINPVCGLLYHAHLSWWKLKMYSWVNDAGAWYDNCGCQYNQKLF